jgi:uncharacterized LabA/DUF88 family protein
MKINVYIDGFNLYYGALKKTPYKWLDISRLCKFLFPRHEIQKIKYYTAQVKLRNGDQDIEKPLRQQIYLRAIKTTPVEIIYGSFLSHTINMKLADNSGYAKVIKTEEKGTDVNIATHLVHDGHNGEYEMAVVISNDSDLVEPIRIVKEQLGLPVVIVNPYERNSAELKNVASSVKHLRKGLLRVSQLPSTLQDEVGTIMKPECW